MITNEPNNLVQKDLNIFLKKIYKELKTPFPTYGFHALIDAFEWVARMPTLTPKNVYSSSELRKRILISSEIEALDKIKNYAATGRNLLPYLGDTTKKIRNRATNKNDWFASDWGLLHFHLGSDLEGKDQRVYRSRRILIAKIEENNAYLIDVVDHGRGFPCVWGDKRHLEVLKRNWPELLQSSFIDRSNPSMRTITSEDYLKLRNSGISSPVEIDGQIYIPNFGISLDGSSSLAVSLALALLKNSNIEVKKFQLINPGIDIRIGVHKSGSIGFYVPSRKSFYSKFLYNTPNEVSPFFKRLQELVPLPLSKPPLNLIFP